LIAVLGLAFLVMAANADPFQYRTAVQAVIFLVLGGGGLAMNRRRRRA
jgi:uncharacterized membrane protein